MANPPAIGALPASVSEVLAAPSDERRRREAVELNEILSRATGQEPAMWGSNIIGYGSVHYRYETGREGDSAAVGFSPRKAAIVLYGLQNPDDETDTLDRLGPHKRGAGCIYVTSLAKVNLDVLEKLVLTYYRRNVAPLSPRLDFLTTAEQQDPQVSDRLVSEPTSEQAGK